MHSAEILFILSIVFLSYIYIGYPIFVWVLSTFMNDMPAKGEYEPIVTILIAAYNEEKEIEKTIKNKLEIDYPKNKLEIIVISDGSRDRTDEIVKKFSHDCVKLIRQEPRAGKTSALNMAVPQARGEIIVFSDANSIYDAEAMKYLIQNFKDPKVGYVTGKMVYTNPDGGSTGGGCSAYMKYENYIRALETKVGSIVGVDGGIDAVRKSLYQSMRPEQLPDFVLPLKVVEQGYRVVYEHLAVLREPSLAKSADEYRMRVRVALRAFWAISDMKHLLNIHKYGLFAWELLSHKCLRYLAFVFLIILYVSNCFLLSDSVYLSMFIMQNAFYLTALITPAMEKYGRRIKALYVPYYFSLINIASAHAFVKFILGQKQILWVPRKG